jgi:hypothetical protein
MALHTTGRFDDDGYKHNDDSERLQELEQAEQLQETPVVYSERPYSPELEVGGQDTPARAHCTSLSVMLHRQLQTGYL